MELTEKQYLVATDVGGTCTDTIVVGPGGKIWIGKALSTPPNFADGVLDSIQSAVSAMGLTLGELLAKTKLFIHGSTVADNTVFTRDGSKTGLLATEGFEDAVLVTRGAYGRWSGLIEERIKHPVKTDRAASLVAHDCILGIPERVDSAGEVVLPLDAAAAEKAIRFLVNEKRVEAIAVSLLWSVYNPAHEDFIANLIRRIAPQVYVTTSADVAPVIGEYERTSTAVINAYAGHVVNNYLNSLQSLLEKQGYRGEAMIMQGYGGLLPASEAANRAIGMIESGPAAGVIGAKFLGDLMGDRNIIAADMGGTTFKVGVIQDGQLEYSREPLVDRFHYAAPKIEVVSIGAGGGSIVTVDPVSRIPAVGPQSAGARPGPVCYGLGGAAPTVTDVMLLLGYLDPAHFLRGEMTLDLDATRGAFKKQVADPLGIDVEEAAIGIYKVASAQITDLIRQITVERGLDPRDFVLHSFGGTCGMLAAAFSAELGVKRMVVPYTASVNCAFGLVAADVVHEYLVAKSLPADTDPAQISALYAPMIDRARKQLAAEGFTSERVALEWSIDLRYCRQVHELTTPVQAPTEPFTRKGMARLIDDFEALYERKYGRGSAYREAGIEMTKLRLTARGLLDSPRLPDEAEEDADASAALIGTRRIYAGEHAGMADAAIYDFTRLRPGNTLQGPAVIHTPITTIVVQSGHRARMDRLKNIIVSFPE